MKFYICIVFLLFNCSFQQDDATTTTTRITTKDDLLLPSKSNTNSNQSTKSLNDDDKSSVLRELSQLTSNLDKFVQKIHKQFEEFRQEVVRYALERSKRQDVNFDTRPFVAPPPPVQRNNQRQRTQQQQQQQRQNIPFVKVQQFPQTPARDFNSVIQNDFNSAPPRNFDPAFASNFGHSIRNNMGMRSGLQSSANARVIDQLSNVAMGVSQNIANSMKDDIINRFDKKAPASVQTKTKDRITSVQAPKGLCPFKDVGDCDSTTPFRTAEGSCNNLQNPWWGKAEIPYKRYLDAEYSDGLASPRKFGKSGNELPNPRVISRNLFVDNGQTEVLYSHILASFGQFTAHDITSVSISTDDKGAVIDCPCGSTNPACMSIVVSPNDGLMKSSCIKFTRSSSAFSTFDCRLGEREQLNLISSFIDGSQIYGIDATRSKQLRSLVGGQLRSSPGVNRRPFLMQGIDGACRDTSATVKCFVAGEGRANENLGLTSLQTLFLRGHNKIAQDLANVNPTWDDERLYQETRRIVIGILQHITYNEFVPTVIGSKLAEMFDLTPIKEGFFDGYDETINPTIANEFSTAAFRFGHTLVRNSLSRATPNNQKVGEVGLDQILFRPVEAYNGNAGGIDSILMGLLNDPAAKFDTSFVDTMQNHLFEFKLPDGTAIAIDLGATNVNRGRDHGIPPYNAFRDRCGLKRAETFQDFTDSIDDAQVQRLSQIYESPDDVDLYVGGLSERPSEGAVIGPTFACIVASQFKDLKKGDRFYFENGPSVTSFTKEQLNEIRKVKLSTLICDNTDMIQIQPNAFLLASSPNNARVPCQTMEKMNLNAWATRN